MSEQEKNQTIEKESGAPDLRDKVVAAIKTVYDPEIPVDVFEFMKLMCIPLIMYMC